MRFFYLYRITNTINERIYIGVHQTEDLEDGYMGSGKYLIAAQKKYGIENFKKEILEFFTNEEEMFLKEFEIVNEEFVKQDNTYNIFTGGRGWNKYSSNLTNERRKFLLENDASFRERYSKKLSERIPKPTKEHLDKMHKICKEKQISSFYNPFLREEARKKTLCLESIEKKKNTYKKNKHQQGEKNSQFGKMWITNGVSNKFIKKDEEIPDGWRRGRIMVNVAQLVEHGSVEPEVAGS